MKLRAPRTVLESEVLAMLGVLQRTALTTGVVTSACPDTGSQRYEE